MSLNSPHFRPLPAFIARQDKSATDSFTCHKRFKQLRRELDRGSIGAFRNDIIHAAPVILKVLQGKKVDAEFKTVHLAGAW